MATAAPRQQPISAAANRRLTLVHRTGGGPPPGEVAQPPVSNAQLGVLIFIAFEAMIFVGLLASYWVLRSASFAWPPPDMPRLPLAVTWVNTAILLFSGFTMWRSVVAIRAGDHNALRSALLATAVLGTVFLVVQGSEWVRLIQQGLTLSSSSFGSIFYTMIGLHGLHVVGAVVWLLAVLVVTQRRHYTARRHAGVILCAMYWYFVCALWVVLFATVYLS